MNYSQTYTDTELEESIRRHNEQVSKQITEKVFGDGLGLNQPAIPWCGKDVPREHILEEIILDLDRVIENQRTAILKALDAIQRGNYDDAKKILEMI